MKGLLLSMRRNPVGDWSIEDVIRLCEEYGVHCSPPSGGGSHYKVSHPTMIHILTVPARRPIKPVYIRNLVKFVAAVGGGN